MFPDEGLQARIYIASGPDTIEHCVLPRGAARAEDRLAILATPMALFGDSFVASSNAAFTKSYAIRPVPVRAESLHADIFSVRKPRSCKSSFGTMTTACRQSSGLVIVCGQDTS